MSLRIRRGTDSQRQSITFDLGEIVYTTDSKKLFVGDGVTVGGVNVVKTAAGSGLSWNNLTQQLDVNGENLSTSNIVEGTNLYFTTDRAQDATASLFTHDGHSNISFTYDDSTNKIFATVTVPGINGQALTTSNIPEGTNLYFTTDRAQDAAAALFTHNGHTNISFTYDDANDKVIATVSGTGSGILSVSADPNPTLGGNLTLNSHNITGVGNINITGDITSTNINGKLGSNLDINSHNITGIGDINITGNVTATTINAKLGSDLNLNSHNITGTGNININGSIGNEFMSTSANVIDSNNGLIVQSSYKRVLSIVGLTTGTLGNSPQFSINSSRGTILEPVGLEANDVVASFLFKAYDGIGDFNSTGGIISQLASTADITKKWPDSTLSFFTGNNSDTTYSEFTFSGNGVLNAPIFKVSSYETLSLPSNPEKGWMVFDSTTNQFKGWTGTAWVILG